MSIKVHWEVSAQGNMEVYPDDVEGMTRDEAEEWIRECVSIEVHEQGNYSISLSGVDDLMKQLADPPCPQ
jgi:hypothetical protein